MKKVYGQLGCGKDYIFLLKAYKKLCIKYYGIGFIFATPKIRAVLIETMKDFIDEICEMRKKNELHSKNKISHESKNTITKKRQ